MQCQLVPSLNLSKTVGISELVDVKLDYHLENFSFYATPTPKKQNPQAESNPGESNEDLWRIGEI